MGVLKPEPGPQLAVDDVAAVVAFYTGVFETVPVRQECLLDGRVLYAELIVGDYLVTASEWYDVPPVRTAEHCAVLAVSPDQPQLLLERALAAGAKLEASADAAADPVFCDPAGQRWAVVGAKRP